MRQAPIYLFLLLLCTVTAYGGRRHSDFVYCEGTRLMLHGKPFQSVGTNVFTLSGCGHAWENFSPRQTDSLFASFPRDFIVRTWAFPGNEGQLEGIIATARKHHIRLILSLGDGRSSCGHFDGSPKGDNSGKVPSWYSDGYKQEYLPHVVRTVSRYRHESCIAMWEVINEPGEAEPAVLAHFVDTVAGVIKSIDPKHLVTVGCFGPWAYGGPKGYQSLLASQHVDVGAMHEYDYDYQESNQIESPHFANALRMMQELGKPLIISETGIESGPLPCRTSPSKRVEAMREKFDVYLRGGASMVLVWNLTHEVRSNGFSYSVSDPLLEMLKQYHSELPGNTITENKKQAKRL